MNILATTQILPLDCGGWRKNKTKQQKSKAKQTNIQKQWLELRLIFPGRKLYFCFVISSESEVALKTLIFKEEIYNPGEKKKHSAENDCISHGCEGIAYKSILRNAQFNLAHNFMV